MRVYGDNLAYSLGWENLVNSTVGVELRTVITSGRKLHRATVAINKNSQKCLFKMSFRWSRVYLSDDEYL